MMKLSDCEEQVMSVMWSCKEAPVLREVRSMVNNRFGHNWASQTVSTFVSRLVSKGCLIMERKGHYCYYTPAISLEEYRKEKLRENLSLFFTDDPEKTLDYLVELCFHGDTEKAIEYLNKK